MTDDRDFTEGYLDGRDPNHPEPGPNRSALYRHSFSVARAEIAGQPIPAAISRANAAKAIDEEDAR